MNATQRVPTARSAQHAANAGVLHLIRDLIEEAISEFHCPPCKEEEWLTTKQTTKALSISEPTLRGMRRRGEIRSMRVGQGYRYQLT